jgi:putative ABC transport system substrate-binding protein
MRRREFITLLGGAVAWPLAARAQQGERIRRIGFLTPFAEGDAEAMPRSKAFQGTLRQLGWVDGSNIRIDYRSTAGPADLGRLAKDLVQLAPDAIVAHGTPAVRALQQAMNTIPVVFVQVTDPVRAGFVASMSQPGGNMTGRSMYEPAMGGKWVELLKEIAPGIKRVALLFNPQTAPGGGSFFLRSLAVEPVPISVADAAGIESGIDAFASRSSGGLFVMPGHHAISSRANRCFGETAQATCNLLAAGIRQRRRSDLLWNRHGRSVWQGGRVRRSHPSWCQARRASGPGTDQIRVSDKLEDRKGTRPHGARQAAGSRRRGDRIGMPAARARSGGSQGVQARAVSSAGTQKSVSLAAGKSVY